jgi:hypothetical protein
VTSTLQATKEAASDIAKAPESRGVEKLEHAKESSETARHRAAEAATAAKDAAFAAAAASFNASAAGKYMLCIVCSSLRACVHSYRVQSNATSETFTRVIQPHMM